MRIERIQALASDGVAYDLEGHLIQDGLLCPPGVCAAIAGPYATSGLDAQLLTWEESRAAYRALLADSRWTILGANIAFDNAVMAADAVTIGEDLMPAIFAAYGGHDPTAGRMFDIQHAEALHAVAGGHLGKNPRTGRELLNRKTGKRGRYSLDNVTELCTGRIDAKESSAWVLRYHELENLPQSQWPPEARKYPCDDTGNTLEDGLVQTGVLPGVKPEPRPHRNLHDLSLQCYTAWALHLGAVWGVRTDPVATEALAAAAQVGRDAHMADFQRLGFIRPDGSEDGSVVMTAVAKAYGCTGICAKCAGEGKLYKSGKKGQRLKSGSKNCPDCSATGMDLTTAPVPLTPTGCVQTSRDVCTESGEESLMSYAEAQEDNKVLDVYVPFLRKGYHHPLNLKPNVVLETGRVSYNDVIQLLMRQVSARLQAEIKKRGARLLGIRDCIIPREGWWFYSNDYTGGELVTHAESCVNLVGFSKMGEALIAGMDVHSAFAASMLGVSYNEFIAMFKGERGPEKKKLAKAFRQAAKPPNFGYPGGMGAARLVQQQREQGPDTPWPLGPSLVWDGKDFVPGYKGLRFCVLIGGAEACGTVKVHEWKERPCKPTCLACLKVADNLKLMWSEQWPENRPYFKKVSHTLDTHGEVVQHYSNRVRGFSAAKESPFCSAANGYFQAFLADIAKRAQCRVSYEQYVRQSVHAVDDHGSRFEGYTSPLYGSRSILFAHDELFGEAESDVAPEVSERVNEIMIEEFRRGCPHHWRACKAEPTLMPRWYKAAECVRDEHGRLTIWEPKW